MAPRDPLSMTAKIPKGVAQEIREVAETAGSGNFLRIRNLIIEQAFDSVRGKVKGLYLADLEMRLRDDEDAA